MHPHTPSSILLKLNCFNLLPDVTSSTFLHSITTPWSWPWKLLLQHQIPFLRKPDTTHITTQVCEFRIVCDFAKGIGVRHMSFFGNNDYFRTNFLFLLLPSFAAQLCSLFGFMNCRFYPFCQSWVNRRPANFSWNFCRFTFLWWRGFFFLVICWVPRDWLIGFAYIFTYFLLRRCHQRFSRDFITWRFYVFFLILPSYETI